MKKTLIATALLAGMITAPAALGFKEFPVGEPVTMNEMEIAAVYLQPVDIESAWHGLAGSEIRYSLRSGYSRHQRQQKRFR